MNGSRSFVLKTMCVTRCVKVRLIIYVARVRGVGYSTKYYPQLALWATRISPALLAQIHICSLALAILLNFVIFYFFDHPITRPVPPAPVYRGACRGSRDPRS